MDKNSLVALGYVGTYAIDPMLHSTKAKTFSINFRCVACKALIQRRICYCPGFQRLSATAGKPSRQYGIRVAYASEPADTDLASVTPADGIEFKAFAPMCCNQRAKMTFATRLPRPYQR